MTPKQIAACRSAAIVLIAAFGGLILFVGVATEVTSQPEFCASHHYIRPYYESWTRSSHRDVPCGKCHFPPGLVGVLTRKWKAIAEVAIYVTDTYEGEPRAKVGDEGCLRSQCHGSAALEPRQVDFNGIAFDHQLHLPLMGTATIDVASLPPDIAKRLPRGRALRCASCHSQIVQGNHVTVTTTTCFLCHFKKPDAVASRTGKRLSDCRVCHEPPTETFQIQAVAFTHAPFTDREVPCETCHASAVRGAGNVPHERCYSCHDRPERLKRFDDHLLIHQVHVTDNKLDCLNCHNVIEHG